jgi:hypothetical protein
MIIRLLAQTAIEKPVKQRKPPAPRQPRQLVARSPMNGSTIVANQQA